MDIKQLFDSETSTYTYLLIDPVSRQAALIDPVKEQFERDRDYIKGLDLALKYSIETHIHADHVTASSLLKQEFNVQTVVHKNCGSTCPDILTQDGETFSLGDQKIKVIATPGHTNTCISLLIDGCVFTGDTLLIRGCGRTDFQSGDAGTLYDSITKKLFTLADETIVYPAHDYAGFTCSAIGEEKSLNPRLGNNKSKIDFVHIMDSLNLAEPRHMAIAVPGNLACGQN